MKLFDVEVKLASEPKMEKTLNVEKKDFCVIVEKPTPVTDFVCEVDEANDEDKKTKAQEINN